MRLVKTYFVAVTLAALLTANGANAAIIPKFFPASDFNANTSVMDAALGITGYTIDTFEQTPLISGLTITLTGGVTATTWTSLPNLFDTGVCGST